MLQVLAYQSISRINIQKSLFFPDCLNSLHNESESWEEYIRKYRKFHVPSSILELVSVHLHLIL